MIRKEVFISTRKCLLLAFLAHDFIFKLIQEPLFEVVRVKIENSIRPDLLDLEQHDQLSVQVTRTRRACSYDVDSLATVLEFDHALS